MNIALGILTCKRPKEQTLPRTIATLGSGWVSPWIIWEDTKRDGCLKSWLLLVERILQLNADAYFLVQDDMIFCKNIREYLNNWPADHNTIALCSPYSPTHYKHSKQGWHLENRGDALVSACAWLIPKTTLIRIITEFNSLLQEPVVRTPLDSVIGAWALKQKLDIWFHSPSLAHHVGVGNSAVGRNQINDPVRIDADFPGEEFSCNDLA